MYIRGILRNGTVKTTFAHFFNALKQLLLSVKTKYLHMESFKKAGIVTDVIDEVPSACLNVKWGSIYLKPGETLTPTQVKDKPLVTFDAEAGSFYTLLMHDPDAPSRADPKSGEWQHWYVTNIPGSEIGKGEELTAYFGAGPPKGTGLHRYIFLLYKQTSGKRDCSKVAKISNTSGQGRRLQKARDIAKKNKLQLVAGNFFQAEWDDYVPKLHAQLH